ncbi:hypothetical protein GE061_007912 [Apolygus lucorum]|uniref:Uncharacterized protein n=1 Tax=Apolygus lucorum TaxID=248454 RepID=A0A8S9WRY4_APOLU|nr:hypothetical protein GE061_007912 [Apolygus lucorum]
MKPSSSKAWVHFREVQSLDVVYKNAYKKRELESESEQLLERVVEDSGVARVQDPRVCGSSEGAFEQVNRSAQAAQYECSDRSILVFRQLNMSVQGVPGC